MNAGTDPRRRLIDLDWEHLPELAAWLRAEDSPEAEVRRWVGELHQLTLEDIRLSLDRSDLLVELADRAAPIGARVSARCARSHALAVANRFDDALGILDEAMQLAQDAGDRHAMAHVDHNAVQPLARLGRLTEAISRAERAVLGFEHAADTLSVAKAHSNLAVIYRMRDDPRKALHHFDLAIPALREMPAFAAQLESNRAEALLDLAEFARAEEAFTRSMDEFVNVGALHAAAVAEGNLADLLGRQGRLDAALRHFEYARAKFENSSASGDAARLESERAEVLSSIGLSPEARESWRDSIPTLERAGMSREAARASVGLASRLLKDGRLDQAELHARRAADRGAECGATLTQARANHVLAGIATRRGQRDRADAMLRDAIEAFADAPSEQAAVMHDAAVLALESGALDRARELIQRGSKIAERVGLPILRAAYFHLDGRLSSQTGDSASARRAYLHAIDQIERMRGVFTGERSRAAWLGGHTDVYHDLARMDLGIDDEHAAERAFHTLERSRARVLLDMVRGGVELTEHIARSAENETEARYLTRLASKRSELNALFSWIDSDSARGRHTREIGASHLSTIEREIASLEGRLAATRRFTEVYGEPVTAERVRARLTSEQALVAFFDLDGRVGAFVLRHDRTIAMPDLCGMDEVQYAAQRLGFQIDRAISLAASGRDANEARHIAHTNRELDTLTRLLLTPVSHELGGTKSLIFVPSDAMRGVPFSALRSGTGYLIESHDISLAPSASLFDAIVADSPTGNLGASLVMGVSDAVAPRVADEARLVGAMLPGAIITIDDESTVDVLSSHAPGCSMIHLCCHGVFPVGQPMQARIRLADRWFSARDAYTLRLGGSTVVLSCCEAGRSASGAGGELFGMGRALLAAGARAVVAGQWAAHDEATLAMFESFYGAAEPQDAFFTKFSAAACLGSAQRSILKRWPHPAFWANFFCIGAP